MDADRLQAYRAHTFHFLPGSRLKTPEEAVAFVQERGFVYFWPIKGILLPSLWVAVAGDRPVADAHDDPGHVSWSWKDSLLGKGVWYYAKVLRKRATIISLDLAPYFYALSENYGSPEEDYLTIYEQGRLTQEARTLYEVLLDQGPLDTVALRKAARITSPESNSRFERALADLQADFKILPVGVTQAGAWHYAFAYDVVHRQFPNLPELARPITERQARLKLTEVYLHSVGAAQVRDLTRLFGWQPRQAQHTLDALLKAGKVRTKVTISGLSGEWVVLSSLWDSPA